MKDVNFSTKKLKKNEEFVNRIEILQDFDFPVTASSLKVSNDGNYIFATGIYPPKMKIFDLNEMSLKCERNFDSEIRKLEVKNLKYKIYRFFQMIILKLLLYAMIETSKFMPNMENILKFVSLPMVEI